MKTSTASARKPRSASARTSTTPARGRAKPSPKKPATTAKATAKKAITRATKAAKPAAKRAAATVRKTVTSVAKKVTAPKDDQARVHDLLAGFSTVMLLTSDGTAKAPLHARPMAIAKLDDDCTLTFMTGLDTAKVDEARKDGVGYVIAQGKTVFLSMHGTVEVVRDRNRIHDLWTAADKVYFPKGKDDPNLCLLVLRPDSAEVWDVSGARGIAYLFEAARALVTGTTPRREVSADTHDTITLHAASA